MICVRLDGGLGNQLFQYATGRALASRHGCALLLDSSRLDATARKVTPRTFELDHFRHQGRLATSVEQRRLSWLPRVAPASHWVSPWRTFVERGPGYHASVESLPDQTYLVGYWQSHRYFSHIAQTIAEELTPARPLSAASEQVARSAAQGMSVSVHVRRGDYVTLPAAANLHGTLDREFYASALDRVNKQVGNARYFVFSDDIAWCRANLPLHHAETVFVDHNTGLDAWQDLVLMAKCKHHIIANSSFSWWGAWLADQRQGEAGHLVIAPARWFAGQPEHDHRDRFPAHWIIQP